MANSPEEGTSTTEGELSIFDATPEGAQIKKFILAWLRDTRRSKAIKAVKKSLLGTLSRISVPTRKSVSDKLRDMAIRTTSEGLRSDLQSLAQEVEELLIIQSTIGGSPAPVAADVPRDGRLLARLHAIMSTTGTQDAQTAQGGEGARK